MANRHKSSETRTLLIRTEQEGELQIEIPANYKVTFGPLSSNGYRDGNALRIYEAENKQRACFVGVISFRDLSIPVKRRVKKVEERTNSKRDSRGNAKTKREVVVDEGEWEEI